MKLETMEDFFAERAEGYDEHMLNEVVGCREGYIEMAKTIPEKCRRLLDLGCGTGLEIDEILKLQPEIEIVGIDMTESMLEILRKKHPGNTMELICGDYFTVPFGEDVFDCAVSFETMHHFKPDAKSGLYSRIYDALKTGGCYIECDYMVGTQLEEDHYFAEYEKLRLEQGIPEGVYCHYDTPCSVETQIKLLRQAGFSEVSRIFNIGNTVMLKAIK